MAAKISVITAVRNRADVIQNAIESVRKQTLEAVEHLIVDGASTDGTLEKIYEKTHSRMTVISEPDSGIYDAINKGIQRAKGEIVGLLHSDDIYAHAKVLENVAEAFKDPAIDAVYGDVDYVSSSDRNVVIRQWSAGEYHPSLLRRGWMPPHPALFLRRRVFDRWGAYDTGYRIAADYDAILRWFSKRDFRAVYIPDVFVKMRVGGASNGTLANLWRKSKEDYAILKKNNIGGIVVLAQKNARKINQFVNNERKRKGKRIRKKYME